MLEHLIPISKKHSIGNVSATIFLPQNVLKIDSLFNKLSEVDVIRSNYPRRNMTYIHSINIDSQLSTMNKKSRDLDGFLFESFDQAGRLQNILRLQNQSDKRTAITFETRRYTNWNDFLGNLIRDFGLISQKYPFYISAIALNYIDDFTWVSPEKIPVREIFNTESELLNNKFLNSDNATLVLQSQNQGNNDKMDYYEERTEISFGNRVKKIIINHQYAKKFDNLEYSAEALETDLIKDYFQEAHDINKDILKGILSKEVLVKINLT